MVTLQTPIVWTFPNDKEAVEQVAKKSKHLVWNIPKIIPRKDDCYEPVKLYREPMTTYCITPNNSPEARTDHRGRRQHMDFEERVFNHNRQTSNLILNTINGLFTKFYAPDRVRLGREGITLKMSDVVSYKIAITDGTMKFYLSVPSKWSKNFVSAIKKDWGHVDITKTEGDIIKFNPSKAKAMTVRLKHHYALSLKHEREDDSDSLYSSISSLASTMGKEDKLLIDYNIEPTNNEWKGKAVTKIKQFKDGKPPNRDDSFTVSGVAGRLMDMVNVIFEEFVNMIEDLMGAEKKSKDKKEQMFELKYSNEKIHANSKGYKMQIRVIGESEDEKKIKHAFRNIETSYSLMDGDNKFTVSNIKSKNGIKTIIHAVENNMPIVTQTKDIYFEREMNGLLKIPNKETLKEYQQVITQDTFTRTEIDVDFLKNENGAIPFGYTLDKEPKKLFMGGYIREDWTDKGRYTKFKTRLDDRSTATMVFGQQGSGKTSLAENQALYTFGANITDKEQWKRDSKSVVVFDVADGSMINNIYNHIPEWQRDRVIILNHSNFNNPISVNNADLMEFNSEIMKDDDYAYTLAEMEAKLVLEILKSDKTMAMDRWFTSALQCVHSVDKDWGYIEAMRTLIDNDFRQEQVIPRIENKRLRLEISTYDTLAVSGEAKIIIQTIQNRFSQLERDQKLWDCIAQKPLRNEDGKVKLNFRKMMDGDADGAYMILIHVPKTGVSNLYRKFIFSHYFTKIWNVALSREVGFAGREYRPETLVIIDEIHQIIDVPLIGKLFIDLFKEPRKYSLRLLLTLHGWSSLAKAGRGIEGDIKQSIMDNGCNLVMLKGGEEAFNSLLGFLQPMKTEDFTNLMNMEFCGIFAIRWKNKNHVIQSKMLPELGGKGNEFVKCGNTDSNFLSQYSSSYGVSKQAVRDDNLDRSYAMIEQSITSGFSQDEQVGEDDWAEVEKVGMKGKIKKESR